MKILLTGANGYIGTRILPLLLTKGHQVVCLVRDPRRFPEQLLINNMITIVKGDLLDAGSIEPLPKDIDAAYYLVHSMSQSRDFAELEEQSVKNFIQIVKQTQCRQIIYLGGITNSDYLSRHLQSRLSVENIIKTSGIPFTVLKASIIIGSGSASFEIIRDLTEKLPVMVAPRWVKTRCQPIAIRDVLNYLTGVLLNEQAFNKTFDIGGADVLSFKSMMQIYAEVRRLKLTIFTLPFLSPRLSSYWLYFVTSTSYSLAQSLVDSMKNETICRDDAIKAIVPGECLTYREALMLAFEKIEQNSIASSWKDALNKGYLNSDFMEQIQVPVHGTLCYKVDMPFDGREDKVLNNIWAIGGYRGWYYWNWIWTIRGIMDRLVGGVGLRRGRRSAVDLQPGDALDFWRVLIADKLKKRLLLYAEMKLPGEAWLEFKIVSLNNEKHLKQTATFRPHGLLGRFYWYALMPFHYFIFNGMAKSIINYPERHLV